MNRLLREKVLLVLFVGLGAAMWLSNYTRRATAATRALRSVNSELAQQKQWIDNQKMIEVAATKAVQNLDPAKTLDDTRLVGDLSAMAREYDLKFTNDTPHTERSGQFAIHTVQVTLPRADWEALKKFYVALIKRSPYIGLEQFALSADRANPQLLNASLRVSSVEIVK
jgi:hypothetical protein